MKNLSFNEWLKEKQKNEGIIDILRPDRKGKVAREKLTRWAWDDPHYPDYPSPRFGPYEFGKGTGGFYATHGGGGYLSDEEKNDPEVLKFYSKERNRRKERMQQAYGMVTQGIKKLESNQNIEEDQVVLFMNIIRQNYDLISQDTLLRVLDRLKNISSKLPANIQSRVLQNILELEKELISK